MLAVLAAASLFLTPHLNATVLFPFPVNPKPNQSGGGGGVAFDGVNYLAATMSGGKVGAQLFSSSGAMIGSFITVDSSSIFPPALAVAFGQGVYLEVWSDNAAPSNIGGGNQINIFGQLIAPSGKKIGSSFHLLISGTGYTSQKICAVKPSGVNFLVVFQDPSTRFIYGQLVTASGALSGPAFLISDQPDNGNGAAVDFDGSNYLVVWQSNNGSTGNVNKTYGEFVSINGSAGNPFQISETTSLDQNPLAVTYDGAHYLVVWDKDTQLQTEGAPADWTLYGRLLSPNGDFLGDEKVLAAGSDNQAFPSLAFDGVNYLLVWTSYTNLLSSNHPLRAQFFDTSANPTGPEFATLPAMGTNQPLPVFNGLIYANGEFLLVGGYGAFKGTASGDITNVVNVRGWGVFIPPTLTPPRIDNQPSSAAILEGTTATLAVYAEGSALNYQWFKNRAKLAGSARISGVNSATLTISNTALADAGSYFVVASNLFGAATSSTAVLKVETAVAIAVASSPAGAGSVTGGGSYLGGTQIALTASVTNLNDCYFFTNWTVAGKVVSTASTYTFSANKSETVTAHFSPFLYKIQTAASPPNGGTTSGGGSKACGSTTQLIAHAKPGFRFVNWSEDGNVISTKATSPFTISGGVLLTANFANTVPPVVTLKSPTGSETTTNSTLAFAGTVKDNAAVTGVYYKVPGSDVGFSAQNDGGWTNWNFSVTLALGTNVIQIYAQDSANLTSATKTVVIVREPAPTVFAIDSTDPIVHPQAQVAFDGNNYLVAYQIGQPNNTKDVAQFVSPSGQLVGGLLDLNPGAAGDPPWVAFDGNNYLTAWADYSDTQSGFPVRGTFVSPDGTVGSPIQLSQSTTVDNFGTISYGGGVYFLMWSDDRHNNNSAGYDDIYGEMLTPAGQVAVSDFEIGPRGIQSEDSQSAAAFDGANFLVVWSGAVGGTSIQGRLVSPAGTFATDPFVIFTNSVHIGAALNCVVFDGTRYLVLFTAETKSGDFATAHIYGRFVTTAGEVAPGQMTVTGDAGPQLFPCAAFSRTQYLITWNQGFNPTSTASPGAINARLFDTAGKPIAPEFKLFSQVGNKIAFFAPVLFDGTKFFSATGLGHMVHGTPNISFTSGVISGAFVFP